MTAALLDALRAHSGQWSVLALMVYLIYSVLGATLRGVRAQAEVEAGWWRGRSPTGKLCPHRYVHANEYAAARCAVACFGGEPGTGAVFQRLTDNPDPVQPTSDTWET